LKLLGVFSFKLLMDLGPFSAARSIFIGCRRQPHQEPDYNYKEQEQEKSATQDEPQWSGTRGGIHQFFRAMDLPRRGSRAGKSDESPSRLRKTAASVQPMATRLKKSRGFGRTPATCSAGSTTM
jgi:hypothetical protein